MNSSIFTSDRATHIKIVMTAVLAATLVTTVGMSARPLSDPHQQAAASVAVHSTFATIDHGRTFAR